MGVLGSVLGEDIDASAELFYLYATNYPGSDSFNKHIILILSAEDLKLLLEVLV